MTTSKAAPAALLLALVLSLLTFQPQPERVSASTEALTSTDLTSVSTVAHVPNTGYVRFIRASHNGSLLFVGLQSGAVLRSADAGRTWFRVRAGVPGGLGLQVLDLQISESDPAVVWAAGLDGVFRSTNGGLSWVEADTRSDGPGRAQGSVLALDPRHPLAAYLVGYRNGGLYLTSDGGLSWQETIPYPVSGVAVDPADGANLYTISRTAGVQRSIDHGRTWSAGVQLGRYAGIGEETANAGRLLYSGGVLYAALDGGDVRRSFDQGRSWQDLAAGLPQSVWGPGIAVPYDLSVVGTTLYTLLPHGASGSSLYALSTTGAAANGIFSSPQSTVGFTATATPTLITMTVTPAPTTPVATSVLTSTAASEGAWQAIADQVSAVTDPAFGTPMPLIATAGGTAAGTAATLSLLGGGALYGVPYQLPPPPFRVVGSAFTLGGTRWPYVYGVNYEGPNDRPWQLWQNGKFDPGLVATDFDAAAATGYKVVRIFVQDPLPQQVLNGEFGHLDTVAALARQRDLRLLITFNDSRSPDLTTVAQVDHLIAAHFAGNPTIFGYDLQNEPSFPDIVGAIYPAGVAVPFQSMALVRQYGERESLKQVRADRRAGKWQGAPFNHLSDQQLYVYLNVNQILGDALNADPSYPLVAPSAKWAPFFDAANATLAAFIRVQLQAVRSADQQHLVTVGYNRLFWAMLPANQSLDFRSIHLYPTSQDWGSVHDALRTFESLRSLARSPLVLEEYGFSTAGQSGDVTSVQESAMGLYLRVLGGEGDFKWVLNDDLVGYNPYENGLGLFGRGGVPKPGFFVNRAAAAYFAGTHQAGGVAMWPDNSSGVAYLYAAADALGVSGATYRDARLRYQAAGAASAAQLWLDWASPGQLRIVSTHDADIWFNLAALTGAVPGPLALSPAVRFDHLGLNLHLHLQAGVWYTLSYAPSPSLPALPLALPRPPQTQGWYVLSTGHNVLDPLLTTWLRLGGESVVGAPLEDAQELGTVTEQYFADVALQGAGTRVSLVPLGLRALGGKALPAARELPKKTKHLYFTASGHNLHGAFLQYWQSTGGMAVWGEPLSEEQTAGSLVTQYFTNAEFVWDGNSVSLAPLGSRLWSAAGN